MYPPADSMTKGTGVGVPGTPSIALTAGTPTATIASRPPQVRVGVGCFVRHAIDDNRFLMGKRMGSHGEGKLALPGTFLSILGFKRF
jgi:hypothetical protein